VKPLSEEEIADGWIEHDGDSCPVHDDAIVEVSLRRIGKATKKDAKRAENWIWSRNTKHPITAYRVVAYPVVDQGEALKAAVDEGVDKLGGQNKAMGDDKPAKDRQEGGDHYQMAIQPIDFIEKNGIGFTEGNIIKYIVRYKRKNGLKDLRKAQHYLEMLIERMEEEVVE